MSSALTSITTTRREKAAVEMCFDQELPRQGYWLGFASTQAPLCVWLTTFGDALFIVGLSQLHVVRALGEYGRPLESNFSATSANRRTGQRVRFDLQGRGGDVDEAEGGTKEFFERHPRSEVRTDLEDVLAGFAEFVLTYALVFVAVGAMLWNGRNGIESWAKINHQIFLRFANDSTAALVALPAAFAFVWLLFRLIDFKVQGLVNFIDAQILAVANRWRRLGKTRPSGLLTGTLARFSDRWHRHIENRKAYAEKQKALSWKQKLWQSLRWWVWPA